LEKRRKRAEQRAVADAEGGVAAQAKAALEASKEALGSASSGAAVDAASSATEGDRKGGVLGSLGLWSSKPDAPEDPKTESTRK